MQLNELFKISNFMSLFRILVIPLLWYFLSRPGREPALIAFLIVCLAAVSDGLDGLLARMRNEVSRLGMILDPFADKVFAGALVILLVIYRDFPIWLAVLILGRDLVILAAAAFLLRGKEIVVQPNLTGKYAFAAISVLLACSVVRFKFGFEIMTIISTALIAASIYNYRRVLSFAKRGETPPEFKDNRIYRYIRLALSTALIILLLAKLLELLMS